MITRFQAAGASAGTAKCSNELSIPTTSPESASSTTIGNIRRARFTVRSASRARTRFGTWKAIVKADIAPVTPKYLAATTSRASPRRRDRPVAKLKKTVLRATRRALPRRSGASVATARRPLHSRRFHGQHPLTRKADTSGGARAPREPAPHFPGEDLVPPARVRGRGGRLGARGRGVPRARVPHRQGRQVGRPPPQQRGPQEGARRERAQPPLLAGSRTATSSPPPVGRCRLGWRRRGGSSSSGRRMRRGRAGGGPAGP